MKRLNTKGLDRLASVLQSTGLLLIGAALTSIFRDKSSFQFFMNIHVFVGGVSAIGVVGMVLSIIIANYIGDLEK